jgi:membrane protein required for colicin V production
MKYLEAYNLIDLCIFGLLFIAIILGLWKGFVRSLTGLASLVFGVLLAVKYYHAVEPYLGRISSLDPQISMILSMVIIFIAVQVVFLVIRRILAALIDLTRLGWLDRTFGAVMGLAAGFLVIAAGVEILLVGIPEWPVVKESRLVRPVDELAGRAMNFAPKGARDQLQALANKWKGVQETSPAKPGEQGAPAKSSPPAPPATTR